MRKHRQCQRLVGAGQGAACQDQRCRLQEGQDASGDLEFYSVLTTCQVLMWIISFKPQKVNTTITGILSVETCGTKRLSNFLNFKQLVHAEASPSGLPHLTIRLSRLPTCFHEQVACLHTDTTIVNDFTRFPVAGEPYVVPSNGPFLKKSQLNL